MDVYVSASIIDGNLWDRDLVNTMMSYIKDKEPGIVIDAGANVGQFTIISASLGHHVYSFEAFEPHVRMISRSVYINNFQANLK